MERGEERWVKFEGMILLILFLKLTLVPLVTKARGLSVADGVHLSFCLNDEEITSSVINNKLSTPAQWKFKFSNKYDACIMVLYL
jgi:hypothetical protein